MAVIIFLFLLRLPADILRNSNPMVIRFNGRSYFPVFKRYTEVDFGGFRQVVPDYRRPGFLALLGQVESGDKPDEEIPSITTPPPTDVLDMFDDEGPGRKRFTCHAV